jgi:hypothetical protein
MCTWNRDMTKHIHKCECMMLDATSRTDNGRTWAQGALKFNMNLVLSIRFGSTFDEMFHAINASSRSGQNQCSVAILLPRSDTPQPCQYQQQETNSPKNWKLDWCWSKETNTIVLVPSLEASTRFCKKGYTKQFWLRTVFSAFLSVRAAISKPTPRAFPLEAHTISALLPSCFETN